jgi:hypothetical protein
VKSKTDLQRLGELWSQWTRLVHDAARGHRRAQRVSATDYHALHGELVAACQKQMDRCKTVRTSIFRRLHALAAPWVNYDTLLHADRHVLAVLEQQCRHAENKLFGRRSRRRSAGFWLSLAGGLITGVLAGLVYYLWLQGGLERALWDWQNRAYRLQLTVSQATPLAKFGLLAILVAAAGAIMLRSVRND